MEKPLEGSPWFWREEPAKISGRGETRPIAYNKKISSKITQIEPRTGASIHTSRSPQQTTQFKTQKPTNALDKNNFACHPPSASLSPLTLSPVDGGVQQNPCRKVRRNLGQHGLCSCRRRRRRRGRVGAIIGGLNKLVLPRRRHVHDSQGRHPALGAGLYPLVPVELDEVQARL